MVQAKQVIFLKAPTEYPVKDEHLTVKTTEVDLEKVPENGVIIKVLVTSVDPYMRGRMREGAKSYVGGFEIGQPISSHGVSRVIRSNNKDFPKGCLVYGATKHQEYQAVEDLSQYKKVENKYGMPLEHYIGVLGMPGMSAYAPLKEWGKLKKGETLFVSAASGAVGSIVGQIAKREGLYVVGSAGTDEKVKYLLDELKFDAAFNYKKESPKEALPKYCPKGIDVYFDNVGGETLDAALEQANDFARFIECGMISVYNKKPEDVYRVKNLMYVVSKRISMNGFIVSDFFSKYIQSFQADVGKWLKDGELVYKEDVTHGIDNEIDGFVGMLQGKNFGKAVIRYADDKDME